METILLIVLICLSVVNLVVMLLKKNNSSDAQKLRGVEDAITRFDASLTKNENFIKDEFFRNRTESNEQFKSNRDELNKALTSFENKSSENTKSINEFLKERFSDFSKNYNESSKQLITQVKDVKNDVEKRLQEIREDNTKQLNEMRKTVDEKLQVTLEKRLGESFKLISDRLEQVHKGLGEMQSIATGVGDLKKVLSNVKTRGVMGEYQLENILEQILSPEQYEKNVATKKGSQANVEFAIKLPGRDSDAVVWMPIDSKFPIENYHALVDAYDVGDTVQIAVMQKELAKRIELFARSIHEKYIDPPNTTDFAIMFLPVESLYAEVLRHPALFETLQRKYKITITGPTTLSALLNSLQMGFRTLAVQKRSSEVWNILETVKKEFAMFADQLAKVDKQLGTAKTSLEVLRNTRTNVLNRKLDRIDQIETPELDAPIVDLKLDEE
ncbi:MAG: DNA recombination protein RmuC [Kiritimatiellae bacterium]|jgi:DNA recombination protein RmuC|nr:DNA recombination protein RmuC [Kiritimatiellia bacterium]